MLLSDIMCKSIIACSVSDDIIKVSNVMKTNDIGFVPIYDDKKIVGVITDRDIVVKVVSNGDFNCDISNYMSKDIISVPVDSDISSVLDVMKKYKVKRLLVTTNNNVCGIVSLSDILNCDLDGEVLNSIKEIFEVGPNIHKYESEIDEFYL